MTVGVSERMSFQTDTRINGQLLLHFFTLTMDMETLIQVEIPVVTKFQRSPMSRRHGINSRVRPNEGESGKTYEDVTCETQPALWQ